jgi:hypothetical protein
MKLNLPWPNAKRMVMTNEKVVIEHYERKTDPPTAADIVEGMSCK